ncbi:transposase [Bradyrhizobium diazoefficiens]|uniref:transposase n=1 Tax=Bradyrhizobium diazoefficiens TaxID=1355477 RepID=UPI00349278B9
MTWQFTAPNGTDVVGPLEVASDDRLVVKLRSTTPADPTCPHCGARRFKNGTRIVRFRDIPAAGGQPVVIEWLRQKFICGICHRSSHDQHAAFDRRRDMTARFVEWVGKEAAERGFTAVAKQTSVNPKVARRAFRDTEKRLARDVGLLSDAIAIEPIDLAGSKRPAIIDAKEEFVFEAYASVDEMRARLPAFASEYSHRHEHPIVVTDLSFVLETEVPPAIHDDLFGPTAVRAVSRISLEREATDRIWMACESLLRRKQPDKDSWRFVRALFARRQSSVKTIARRQLMAWKKMEPELYAAYELKEDFLNIWQPEAGASVKGRLDAWVQRIVKQPVLHLEALAAAIAAHREQILAFYRYDFLVGFYEELNEITSLDENRTARSFSAARATLLARGLAQEKTKLANLIERHAEILKGER